MQLRPIAAYSLAALVALGLAGCSVSPPPAGDPAAETQPAEVEAAESAEATAPDDVDPGAADAPVEGWPAEVPVPDGRVQQDASTGDQVVVAFEVDDVATAEAYSAELESAGFAPMEEGSTEIGGVVANVYQGAGYIVAVSTVEAGGIVLLSVAIQQL